MHHPHVMAAKRHARHLRAFLRQAGAPIQQTHALELIALSCGVRGGWNALAPRVPAHLTPTPAQAAQTALDRHWITVIPPGLTDLLSSAARDILNLRPDHAASAPFTLGGPAASTPLPGDVRTLLLFGTAGSGKTTSVIHPAALASADRGVPTIIVDGRNSTFPPGTHCASLDNWADLSRLTFTRPLTAVILSGACQRTAPDAAHLRAFFSRLQPGTHVWFDEAAPSSLFTLLPFARTQNVRVGAALHNPQQLVTLSGDFSTAALELWDAVGALSFWLDASSCAVLNAISPFHLRPTADRRLHLWSPTARFAPRTEPLLKPGAAPIRQAAPALPERRRINSRPERRE